MHKFKLKQISLAICLAAMPFAADAAGLGKLTVVSGLGEPLSAEIELIATTADELSSLTAAIAPEEAYNVQGVERTAIHNAIKIDVTKRTDGTPILKLTTRQPVSDPFLDMLIQVDWSTGRLLREYTVLLDPPGYADRAPMNASPATSPSIGGTESDVSKLPPLQQAVPLAGESDSRSGKSSGKKKSASGKSSPVLAESGTAGDMAGTEHTTVRGDTLSAIAMQNKVEGVSLDQMLVGLYRANKQAFAGANMNRLKVGQIVRMPTAEELQAIPSAEASKEVKVQTADWQAYRNKLAGIVAESVGASEEAGNQASGGKITTPAEDKAAPAQTGPRDVVKLSKSDTAADAKAAPGDAKAMQEKLNALQEEVTAREKGLKEADERTAMLEKQIADMQKLLAVKNQSMAEAQKSAAAQNETKPGSAPATEAPTTATAPAPATKPEPQAKPEAAATATEKPAATPAATNKPQAKPAAPAAKKPVAVMPPPAPVEEPGLLDSLLENPILLAALAAIIALFGGWFFMRNRRKSTLDGFEQGILTSGGLKANTVFGNTSGGTVDTGDTSFLTDFSQSSGGMIDTHDVDPIAEAEVYMAYGRDTQAEEILKDAISKEPKRYELHLKLLEILSGRKDTAGFETLAGELYSQLGSTDPVWAKVADLGHKLEPSNPLYQANAAAAAPVAAQSTLEASDFADAEVLTESSLDFSLDAESPMSSAGDAPVAEAPANSDLDFDLGMSEPASESTISQDEAPISAPLDSGATISMDMGGMDMGESTAGLDFQLDLPEQAVAGNSQLDMADLGTMPSLDVGELNAGGPATANDAEPMEAPTVQLDVSDFGNTMPNLEVPTFDLPESAPAIATGQEDPDLAAISFDLPEVAADNASLADAEQTISVDVQDFDKTMMIQPGAMEEISFEPVAETEQALDLEFGALEATEPQAEAPDATTELDLSGISLDLGEPAMESVAPSDASLMPAADVEPALQASQIEAPLTQEATSTQGESDEVNTKLDLVTAYMEIGDNEGARELLDEVMKEGGPKQQARAKEILATIA